MSHLRSLSKALNRIKQPKVQKISLLGLYPGMLLENAAFRPASVSKTIREYQVPSLLMTAASNGLASLSANQIEFGLAAFATHKRLEPNKWKGYSASPSDYNVYINPLVLSVSSDDSLAIEECPSIPNVQAQVLRNNSICVEYLSITGDYVEEKIDGFEARVFLHEIDHLQGFLMTSFSVCFGNIQSTDDKLMKSLIGNLKENKLAIQQAVERHEDFVKKMKQENVDDKVRSDRSFVEREISDKEFEIEFRKAVRIACMEDYGGGHVGQTIIE